jgi:hypothetical protein
MSTARDLINDAYKYSNITQEPDDKQALIGLDGLNTILNLLNIDGFFSFNIQQFLHTPTSDLVTIGDGGDIDTDYPINVDKVFVSRGSLWDELTQINPMNMLNHKVTSGGIACVYSYTGFPLGKIEFDSAPNAQVAIYVRPSFPIYGINDEVVLPVTYQTLVRWALACHLGTFFATENLPVLIKTRDDIMSRIRSAGARRQPNTYKPIGRKFDIKTYGWN